MILAQPPLCLPAHGECEVVVAALDAVLRLQVCHELCTLAIDGLNQVPRAQGSQGSLAASMDLWVDKSDGWAFVTTWPGVTSVLNTPTPALGGLGGGVLGHMRGASSGLGQVRRYSCSLHMYPRICKGHTGIHTKHGHFTNHPTQPDRITTP